MKILYDGLFFTKFSDGLEVYNQQKDIIQAVLKMFPPAQEELVFIEQNFKNFENQPFDKDFYCIVYLNQTVNKIISTIVNGNLPEALDIVNNHLTMLSPNVNKNLIRKFYHLIGFLQKNLVINLEKQNQEKIDQYGVYNKDLLGLTGIYSLFQALFSKLNLKFKNFDLKISDQLQRTNTFFNPEVLEEIKEAFFIEEGQKRGIDNVLHYNKGIIFKNDDEEPLRNMLLGGFSQNVHLFELKKIEKTAMMQNLLTELIKYNGEKHLDQIIESKNIFVENLHSLNFHLEHKNFLKERVDYFNLKIGNLKKILNFFTDFQQKEVLDNIAFIDLPAEDDFIEADQKIFLNKIKMLKTFLIERKKFLLELREKDKKIEELVKIVHSDLDFMNLFVNDSGKKTALKLFVQFSILFQDQSPLEELGFNAQKKKRSLSLLNNITRKIKEKTAFNKWSKNRKELNKNDLINSTFDFSLMHFEKFISNDSKLNKSVHQVDIEGIRKARSVISYLEERDSVGLAAFDQIRSLCFSLLSNINPYDYNFNFDQSALEALLMLPSLPKIELLTDENVLRSDGFNKVFSYIEKSLFEVSPQKMSNEVADIVNKISFYSNKVKNKNLEEVISREIQEKSLKGVKEFDFYLESDLSLIPEEQRETLTELKELEAVLKADLSKKINNYSYKFLKNFSKKFELIKSIKFNSLQLENQFYFIELFKNKFIKLISQKKIELIFIFT